MIIGKKKNSCKKCNFFHINYIIIFDLYKGNIFDILKKIQFLHKINCLGGWKVNGFLVLYWTIYLYNNHICKYSNNGTYIYKYSLKCNFTLFIYFIKEYHQPNTILKGRRKSLFFQVCANKCSKKSTFYSI